MKLMRRELVLGVTAGALIGIVCSCFNPTTGPGQFSAPEGKYGYIHNADGSPCVNANVVLVPSDYVPTEQETGKSDAMLETTTDENGRYAFAAIAPGIYNVFAAEASTGEMVSFRPAVPVVDPGTPQCISRDTLSAAGGIKGVVRLYPPADNRKVLILVIGSNTICTPEDEAGNFRIVALADGTYRIRFLPLYSAYPVLDTVFTVEQGKVCDVGTIYIGAVGTPKTLKENQDAYVAMKFGVLVHFNMSTFTRYNEKSVTGEWAFPGSNPNSFNPSKLDCGQWADAAKAAGCKYMILTVKHHDGFCLWNSRFTIHDVGSSSWGAGGRDVVKEFVDSARTRKLKVGFYYSIWDKTNGHKLPFIKGQLTELLTQYGEITCLWFDGWDWMVKYTWVPVDTVKNVIRRFQPKCLQIENKYYDELYSDIEEFEIPVKGEPKIGNVKPSEACESLRTDGLWFWHPFYLDDLLSVEKIKERITSFHSRNANYLLCVSPDTAGLLPRTTADRLKEVGQAGGTW